MRHRSSFRDALEYVAAVLILTTLEYSPLAFAGWLSRRYARLLDLAVPRLRRTAFRNLELALPELGQVERERIVRGVFQSIARLILVFARLPHIDRSNVGEWIRYEGFEHFERSLGEGKGVLFATAHLGNWELSAHAHAILSAPMHVVVRRLDNRRLDALVETRRTLTGNQIIEKKDFARGILKALADNQAVGILVDQNTSPEQGVFVDFFGLPACSHGGLARVAGHSGARVIPGFALWSESERRYILRFYPPVAITGDVAADTGRVQSCLESVIREHPEQWLWIHRRWKTRPPGGPPLY